ncbi:MAG: hypothetical protein N4A76_08295 [Firmicutes bacterium]|jgi:CBS domain containing-hemolysin-like protein|nr:hypothetical protein [Bacillota bacterium]
MKKKTKNNSNKKYRWIINVSISTFIIAILMSVISEFLMRNLKTFLTFFVLILIVLVGIIFDTIGIAVTSADIKHFNAMASRKIKGAKYGVKLVSNAGQVSNFCNDVIGDIAGIVSGSAIAVIVLRLSTGQTDKLTFLLNIILSAVIAAITVGGKAIGKEIAISKSTDIVHKVGIILEKIENKTGIKVIK